MISLVVAMGKNRCIGKDGVMPWHLPADLKHFRKVTSGHPVIMGRKTFESIGKPLPSRTNIIISRNKAYFQEEALVVGTVKEALKFGQKIDDEVFVIGGGEIFKQTLEVADQMIITEIQEDFHGDTFFPEYQADEWETVNEEYHQADEKNPFDFIIKTLQKKNLPVTSQETLTHE